VKERKEYLQGEKNERPEAIWTRPSCLKFFQIEELKSNDEELEKQGKRRFFLEGIIWTMKEKKKEIKKQIYKEKEKDKNHNAINKEKKEQRKKKEGR